ncbi:MAG: peptidoglycan DD-metalloendopeptidase family protein [Gammaproteobacteria bacterium]|nr:peptidoglycan DD-metalloendopeptidase family protein [Gammaproteobacteria bacterium]
MQRYSRHLTVIILSILLLSCSTPRYHHVPVVNVSTIEPIPTSGTHRVKNGETLYAIAWRYGMDHRTLATINHLPVPWHVKTGQVIQLRRHTHQLALRKKTIVAKHTHQSVIAPTKPILSAETSPESCSFLNNINAWRWPAHGSIKGIYSSFNKGINISGKVGDPIFATAPGQVVYQGSGLRGYGNLIIIRHNGAWLSAYAWNQDVLVKQGQCVHRGQRIATMGQGIDRIAMLHFEIRRSGRPVNPLHYLSVRG